jgi:hypothetical protein
MATKKRHPNKSTFKDNGITAYTATGPGFIEEASVNVHPDDEDAAIELFEELGYSINSTQTLEDTAAWQWGAKNKSHHKELLTEYQDKIENAVGELEGKKVSRVDEF